MDTKENTAKVDVENEILNSTSDQILSILEELYQKGFNILIDIFAVDYPQRENRIEIIYLLLDIVKNKRISIKLQTPLGGSIPSATEIFRSANWLEREVFDMYGTVFSDHPKLERILTDYGFEGHPMLKNFPLTGYREVRYDMESSKVVYEDVSLPQDYRNFDFLTPWNGQDYDED